MKQTLFERLDARVAYGWSVVVSGFVGFGVFLFVTPMLAPMFPNTVKGAMARLAVVSVLITLVSAWVCASFVCRNLIKKYGDKPNLK